MIKNRLWKRIGRANFLTLAAASVLTVGLLLWFLPRESSKFGYKYDVNQPWRYSALIAEFNFPVQKAPEQIKSEADSIVRSFYPYYTMNAGTAEEYIAAFRHDYQAGRFKGVPVSYFSHVARQLREAYDIGIAAPEQLQLSKYPAGLRVVEGQKVRTVTPEVILTTRTAYERIMHADTIHFTHELLACLRIHEYLHHNLTYDAERSEAEIGSRIEDIQRNSGAVMSGEKIIDQGEVVTPLLKRVLDSYKFEMESKGETSERYGWQLLLGQFILTSLCVCLLVFYLVVARQNYVRSRHHIALLFSLVTVLPLLTYVMVSHTIFHVLILPFAIVPIFIRIFMDSRTAFVALIVTVILAAIPLSDPYEFILIQIVAGGTAIFSLKELTERSQLVRVAGWLTLTALAAALGYDLVHGLMFRTWSDLAGMDFSHYKYLAVGGIFMLFAYPLLYLIERVFSFTSSVTLVELTNINHPLLRRMSKEAQGTFNHSMQVANLAAEVAAAIGANMQLVRTGALYHDIGKMSNPAFFTENQNGQNPHDQLPEEQSAKIIIDHVRAGVKMAERYRLPEDIRAFIATHHGLGRTKYFYIQWLNKHPGQTPAEEDFAYPGPNPSTREQAILMMCDAVEASSRSLKEYSEETISALVNKIVDGQVAEGYFKNCPITFKDIADAKQVLTESLKTVYHTRISYPELQQEKAAEPETKGGSLFGTGLHTTWKR